MRDPFPFRSVRMSAVLPLLLAGCGAEVLSDYTLQVVPHVLGGQDPFATEPSVKLYLQHPDGTSEILYLGEAKGGQVEMPDVGPLAAGTVVGLLLEEPGGEKNKYNPSKLLAYGEARLEQDLDVGEQQVELGVLLPQARHLGDMGELGKEKRSLHAAVAMLPGGDVFVFGGSEKLFGATAPVDGEKRILRMSDVDDGDWSFQKAGNLPAPTVSATATVVESDDGEPLVFVAGGRPQYASNGFGYDTALLYDPDSEEIVWEGKLAVGRSEHRAIALPGGDVFLYGGIRGKNTSVYQGSGTLADPFNAFEIFDLDTRKTTLASGGFEFGHIGMAAASLGADGVLVCGGANTTGINGDTYTPVAGCNIVTLQGGILPAPALPEAVQVHAMAPLPNGQVLACGGVLEAIHNEGGFVGFEEATNKAWVFDGARWEEVGSMTFARANHAAIPTPDGKVVIVGGGSQGAPSIPEIGQAVNCTEIFDPATRGFTTAGASCTAAGAGAWPAWSAVEGEGAFVLGGHASWVPEAGGDAYGMLGFGPDL